MSEKAPGPEKPFFPKLHSEWLSKKLDSNKSTPLVTSIVAAGLGGIALATLGMATPFALAVGAGSVIGAGYLESKKAKK
jgi:hypothetical protein